MGETEADRKQPLRWLFSHTTNIHSLRFHASPYLEILVRSWILKQVVWLLDWPITLPRVLIKSCMCQVNYMPRIDLSSIYWHSAVYVTLCSLGERSTNWATRATQMVGVRIYNTTQHNTKANSNHCAMAQYTITLTHCNWWAINPI